MWPVVPLTRAQTTTLIDTAASQIAHRTLRAAGRSARTPRQATQADGTMVGGTASRPGSFILVHFDTITVWL